MSQEKVKFVLDGYARFNAGERVPELWFFTPDAEYHAAREDPDAAVHRGIDAVRRQYARWVDAYPDLTVEPLEAKGSGDKVFLWCASAVTEREVGWRWRWRWHTC